MTTPTPTPPNRRGRGGNGRFTKSIDTAERDAEACRLRTRGMTYSAIAAQLGYADKGEAHHAVERARLAIITEPAAAVRDMELARLDEMWIKVLEVLERRHVTVSHGRLIFDENEQPLLDDGPVLASVDRLLRIQARRAALLGLDAPTKVEQSGAVKYEVVGVDVDHLR